MPICFVQRNAIEGNRKELFKEENPNVFETEAIPQ
jgi:hypothetical protein